MRTNKNALPPMTITLDEKYLDKWILVDDIKQIPKDLSIKNVNGKDISLSTFTKILEESHYVVQRKRKTVNKIRNTYYYIHR